MGVTERGTEVLGSWGLEVLVAPPSLPGQRPASKKLPGIPRGDDPGLKVSDWRPGSALGCAPDVK